MEVRPRWPARTRAAKTKGEGMRGDEGSDVVIVGAGIGGCVLALALHQVGIRCQLLEASAEIKPLGVGLNLLPHAIRDLAQLGLQDELTAKGVLTQQLCFYTSKGQRIYSEPRGQAAGYSWPQVSIHRGDLHAVLIDAVHRRLG